MDINYQTYFRLFVTDKINRLQGTNRIYLCYRTVRNVHVKSIVAHLDAEKGFDKISYKPRWIDEDDLLYNSLKAIYESI